MRNSGCTSLIDESASFKTGDSKRLSDGMGRPSRKVVNHHPSAHRRSLKTARAPSTVHEKAGNPRITHYWAGIRRNVDDAGPLAKNPEAPECRKLFSDGR